MFKAFDGEIEKILERMEELANEGKEELGKRQPGETCAYERIGRAVSGKDENNVSRGDK